MFANTYKSWLRRKVFWLQRSIYVLLSFPRISLILEPIWAAFLLISDREIFFYYMGNTLFAVLQDRFDKILIKLKYLRQSFNKYFSRVCFGWKVVTAQ